MSKKKIFVIDDDAAIGEIVKNVLEEEYEVYAFTHGAVALRSARKDRPDAVVLDYFLLGEKAEDIIQELRMLSAHIVIILISASRSIQERSKTMAVNDFIAKPFQREDILNALRKNLH